MDGPVRHNTARADRAGCRGLSGRCVATSDVRGQAMCDHRPGRRRRLMHRRAIQITARHTQFPCPDDRTMLLRPHSGHPVRRGQALEAGESTLTSMSRPATKLVPPVTVVFCKTQYTRSRSPAFSNGTNSLSSGLDVGNRPHRIGHRWRRRTFDDCLRWPHHVVEPEGGRRWGRFETSPAVLQPAGAKWPISRGR